MRNIIFPTFAIRKLQYVMKGKKRQVINEPQMASEAPVGYEPEVFSAIDQRKHDRRLKTGAEVFNMMESLRDLSALQQGWDGYNASPVSHQAIDNLFAVLGSCQDEDLLGWQAFPEINGSLLLQNNELRAGINLGDETFSYFVIHGNSVTGGDNLSFTAPSFVSVLRRIND